jgi:hypothetical protein
MELCDKLFTDVIKFKPKLNEVQKLKLKQACQKSIDDNPNLSYNEQLKACKVYLNFIIQFPNSKL